MKVKKLLAVILSVVLVMSCTMICASAGTKSESFAGGYIYSSVISTSARAYTEYGPGSAYMLRYVSATFYYIDAKGIMRDTTRSKSLVQNESRVTVTFSGNDLIGITSNHKIGNLSTTLSAKV